MMVAMFGSGKKKEMNRQIVGFTKARKILFFTIKPKPIYRESAAGPAAAGQAGVAQQAAPAAAQKQAGGGFAARTTARHPELAASLAEIGMKIPAERYVAQCMNKAGIIAAAVMVVGGIVIFMSGLFAAAMSLLLAVLIGMAAYFSAYQALLMYPVNRVKSIGKDVEKDILFAARDMIVSMRSGLPLFNAMVTVSTGYGAASREFEKIIDRVQLAMPMEQAIDEVSAKSQSKTFKRLMLQASTSIRVGADIITAIQEVVSDVSQERIIELRRYGQKLNAIAMFYMLFGVIFPSMGLAVASIMSSFISFIPISNTTLLFAAAGILALQIVFLNLVASSRPSFTT